MVARSAAFGTSKENGPPQRIASPVDVEASGSFGAGTETSTTSPAHCGADRPCRRASRSSDFQRDCDKILTFLSDKEPSSDLR